MQFTNILYIKCYLYHIIQKIDMTK